MTEQSISPAPIDDELRGITNSIKDFYLRLLAANELPEAWVKSILLVFLFNEQYQKKYHGWRMSIGKPMILRVQIKTDLGGIYESENGCNCLPHNPLKEQRRDGF